MDNRAIGVFDSGVGGLTVLKEIIRENPCESTIYFGDTARFPYGPKDLDEVKGYIFEVAKFLFEKDIKMLVIACNTGSSVALNDLREYYDIPVIGVIEPGARTAVSSTVKRRIGVIATSGTVRSRAYEIEIARLDPGIRTLSVAAPKLVDFVEKGILSGSALLEEIRGYLRPIVNEDIDVLIMGCTHYPIIKDQIASCSGDGIELISSATETAKDVKRLLKEKNIQAGMEVEPKKIFYETSNSSSFFKLGKMVLGKELKKVIRVKLDI
ncbi:MAG: glutamate racemase [Actinobacteria bacterium]|nr:glutamate racemase [Actinomycetota bacterium]